MLHSILYANLFPPVKMLISVMLSPEFYSFEIAIGHDQLTSDEVIRSDSQSAITSCRQTRGIVSKSHTTSTRHQEDKQSITASSLFSIEMIAKLELHKRTTNHRTITESNNGNNNQQRINNNTTTALERTAA